MIPHPEPVLATAERLTVFYARVTRDESVKAAALETQVARFEEMVRANGWRAHVCQEPRGVSGERTSAHRPALKELLDLIADGIVERVVVRHIDRLGRGAVAETIMRTLATHGVELYTFDGPVDLRSAAGRLQVRLQAAVGAFETERTGERLVEKKRSLARSGRYTGGPAPFGYTSQARVRRELEAAGMPADEARVEAQQRMPVSPGLVVDEDEAAVVRLIFECYVTRGMGGAAIAAELAARDITKRGHRFSAQAVRKVLHDPKVAGLMHYDEAAYDERSKEKAAKHQQTLYEGQHAAIIDRDLWDAADRLLGDRGARVASYLTEGRIYPLSGALRCQHGHNMKGCSARAASDDGPQYWYYRCGHRASFGAASCDQPFVPSEVIEAAVAARVSEIIASPEHLHEVVSAANQTLREHAPEDDQSVAAIEEEIRTHHAQRERLYRLLADTDTPDAMQREFMLRVVELAQRIRELERERSALVKRITMLATEPISVAAVAATLERLPQLLTGELGSYRELVLALSTYHRFTITLTSDHEFRIDLSFPVGAHAVTAGPAVALQFHGVFRDPVCSVEAWVVATQATNPTCVCGCGGAIQVRPQHHSTGIPRYLQGHHRSALTKAIEQINREGYLTISQVAARLGVGESTIRRAEARGTLIPEWRRIGKRRPMRVYPVRVVSTLERSDLVGTPP